MACQERGSGRPLPRGAVHAVSDTAQSPGVKSSLDSWEAPGAALNMGVLERRSGLHEASHHAALTSRPDAVHSPVWQTLAEAGTALGLEMGWSLETSACVESMLRTESPRA